MINNSTSRNFGKLPSPFNLSLRKKQHKQLRKRRTVNKKFIFAEERIDTVMVREATPQQSKFKQPTLLLFILALTSCTFHYYYSNYYSDKYYYYFSQAILYFKAFF